MGNIELLANNIKQFGRAEITISGARDVQQANQRINELSYVLYQRVGPQLMNNVEFILAQ